MPSQVEFSLPHPAPEAAAHSHELAEHIAGTIAQEGGWIPFSRYMELALYAPGFGYYAAGSRKIGAEGDFVTAPEISPMFARCLAMQVRQVLEQTGGEVLELGPGSGVLAADLFAELKAHGAAPSRYRLLEVSPELRERQRACIAGRHPGDIGRFEWIDRLPQRIDGVVLANEVLDVLPCALVIRAGAQVLERGVVVTEAGFGWEDMAIPEGELKRRAQAVIPAGDYPYLTEVNLAAEALVRSVAAALGRGLALFIDYGFAQNEYYHPQRSMGTLRCHYRHRIHNDPFFLPGLQDITAHVDFTAMALAAQSAGAEVMGYTTQAHFLISCGLAVFVSEGDAGMTLSRLKATSAVHRLIGPSEMGELFKVLGVARGVEPPLLGFQSARPLALGIAD
ncbi:MAG TPA: SAM-dependent methyltransferase [Usitatibacteraceae bacterium]|nr:SAM-dependent methyltransferase [Usitatibacteraceae bacterium]